MQRACSLDFETVSLVERADELATAETALRAAEAGRGAALILRGPPGIGRSALLDAIAESPNAKRFRLLRAGGTAVEQEFAFGVVQQLFQPLLAGPQREVDSWLRGAAGLARRLLVDEPWSATQVARETVLHGLHTLVVNVSEDRPVLVVIDDLQRADPHSLRWLCYLARRLTGARVMVVGAVCEDCETTDPVLLGEIEAAASHVLRLPPLSDRGVRDLVVGSRGVDDGSELPLVCHEVTGGCPAAVVELLSRVPASGTPMVGDLRGSLQQLLRDWRMSCLAAAPATVRDLAEALVVLGDVEVPQLVWDLAGLDRVAYQSALGTLARLSLLADTDPPQFVHPTVHAAIAAAMTVETRSRLHRRAAKLLHLAGYSAEQVGDQLLLVGSGFEGWEIDVLRNAAAAALGRGATGVARHYLRAALMDTPADGVDRAHLLVDLAAAERGVDPVSAGEHILRAVPSLESPAERASALLWLPPAIVAADPALEALVRHAFDELTRHGPAGVGQDLLWRMEARVHRLSMQDAMHLARPIRRLRSLDIEALVCSGAGREFLVLIAYAAVLTAGLPAASVEAIVGRVLECEPTHPAHVYSMFPMLVQAATAVESVAALELWLNAARDEARRVGSRGEQRIVAAERALFLAATGWPAEARSAADAVADGSDPVSSEASSMAFTALATVALETHDVDLATWIGDADRRAGHVTAIVAGDMVRGMVESVRGDPATALEYFLDCGQQLIRCGRTGPSCAPWRVWAAMQHRRLGQLDAAADLAATEYRAAKAWGAPVPLGRSLRLRGVLADGSEGIDLLYESHTVLRRSANPIELARTAVTLGRTLRAAGLPGAPELLAEGERIVAERGATWVQDNQATAIHGPMMRIVCNGRERLTGTEDAVVALALRGWTNQRIADAHEVTRRAVEKNLTSAYRKLGLSGRADLIERFGPTPGIV